jgi:hypothetical protein
MPADAGRIDMSAPRPPDARGEQQRRANVRTALTFASIAAVFFVGVIVARYLGGVETGMTIIGLIGLLFIVIAIGRNLRDRR